MSNNRFPVEMIDFCRRLSEQFVSTDDQMRLCEEKFKVGHISRVSFYSFRSLHGIKTPSRWTKELKAFLREQIKTHTINEVTELIREKFSWPDITRNTIKGALTRYSIKTGRTGRFQNGNIPYNKGKKLSAETLEKIRASGTMFEKGNRPHNELPIGSRVISKDGYIYEKVRDDLKLKACERWRPVQALIWEKHFGPVPKGKNVIFLDGDKRNFDINNLACIDNAEHLEMIRLKLRTDNSELSRVGVNIAKLNCTLRRKREKKKK